MKIDVAIPSYGGEDCILETLDALDTSAGLHPEVIETIHFDIRDKDGDRTPAKVENWCIANGYEYTTEVTDHNLPEARTNLISRVDTDWFLFLDDDVRMRPNTLHELLSARSPNVGAIQSRKGRHEHDDTWSKWRAVRATFFCTLVRHRAVACVEFPRELAVLEEEWLRKRLETNEWLWIFDHRAIIDHDNQHRHTTAQEGYLAGKYGLLPAWYVLLHVPYSWVRMDRPGQHTKRALGYLRGLRHDP